MAADLKGNCSYEGEQTEDRSEENLPNGTVREIVSRIESGLLANYDNLSGRRLSEPIPHISIDATDRSPDTTIQRPPSPDVEGSSVSRLFPLFGSLSRKKSCDKRKKRNSQFYSSADDSSDIDLVYDGDASHCPRVSSPDCPNDTASFEFAPLDSDGDSMQNVEPIVGESGGPSKKAFLVAKELVTSERTFIETLQLLNVHFRNFVEFQNHNGKAKIIPDADLKKILNQLQELQLLNENLLSDLEGRLVNWETNPKIADVIVKKGAFLKIYATYIQNFEAQTQFLDECCVKYPKFGKLVKDFEATDRCKKLSIKHYMLKPIQRIPQYRLLLDDYLKYLNETSPDYEDTLIALRIVTDVAEHVNNSMKHVDKVGRMIHLQSMLSDFQLIKPGRILIKDGALQKMCRKTAQDRYIILLNDALLYATPSKSYLKFHQCLSLGGMKVSYNEDDTNQFGFIVHSTTKSFILCAKSECERKEWVNTLQTAITDYTLRLKSFMIHDKSLEQSDNFKLGKEAPVWIQDGKVTMCQSCTAEFRQFFRRHHCRACGKVICGNCGNNQAPLQYKDFKSSRVCDSCYDLLLAEFNANVENITNGLGAAEGEEARHNAYLLIKSKFARSTHTDVQKRHIPNRLREVSATDPTAAMSGWLRKWKSTRWKLEKSWYLLKDRVLYVYGASQDVIAIKTIPVLGYKVDKGGENSWDGVRPELVFQLIHPHQAPIVFAADSEEAADRWFLALTDATNFDAS